MAVFPKLGSYGNADKTGYRRTRRIYDDGTTRSFKRSTFKHRELTLVFSEIPEADRNTIQSFFDARQADNADFTVYNPQETRTVDLSGASATGRHTAFFLDDELEWTMDSPCRYSAELRVFLKD